MNRIYYSGALHLGWYFFRFSCYKANAALPLNGSEYRAISRCSAP